MKKFNKVLLSSTILPITSTIFIPLANCGQKIPEGYVTQEEWTNAAFELMFLAANKPTFYAYNWDDHISMLNMDNTLIYRLEDFIVNKNIIYAKDKVSNSNWYDVFGDNINYAYHNVNCEISDVYNSIIPRLFVVYFYNAINNYSYYKFNEVAGQYRWEGDMPELSIKDVTSIISFNDNKKISLIRLAYTNIDESSTPLNKIDIELHLKYEAKAIEVDPTFEERVTKHTIDIKGNVENSVDMTSAATETEGFIWKLKNIKTGSTNITITDNGEPVDIFDDTGANAPTIYKNQVKMETSEYSIFNGKLFFKSQLKSSDTINLFFKPKVYAKAYTVKIN